MEAILAEQRVWPRFVDAVDGCNPDAAFAEFWNADQRRKLLNAGEIGCMLSHISIWRQIIAEGLPCAVILEDDLCVASGFGAVVAGLGALPDLGLLKLETDRDPVVFEATATAAIGPYKCHRLSSGVGRTGAYAIWQAAAARLLGDADTFVNSIDIEMFRPRQARTDRAAIHQLVPAIAVQAELVQGLANELPFLESSIASYGDRADTRLGYRRKEAARAVRLMRAVLRPIKHGLWNLWYRNFGLRRLVVDCSDEGPAAPVSGPVRLPRSPVPPGSRGRRSTPTP